MNNGYVLLASPYESNFLGHLVTVFAVTLILLGLGAGCSSIGRAAAGLGPAAPKKVGVWRFSICFGLLLLGLYRLESMWNMWILQIFADLALLAALAVWFVGYTSGTKRLRQETITSVIFAIGSVAAVHLPFEPAYFFN